VIPAANGARADVALASPRRFERWNAAAPFPTPHLRLLDALGSRIQTLRHDHDRPCQASERQRRGPPAGWRNDGA